MQEDDDALREISFLVKLREAWTYFCRGEETENHFINKEDFPNRSWNSRKEIQFVYRLWVVNDEFSNG